MRAESKIAREYDGPKFDGPVEILAIFDEEGIAVTITPFEPIFEKKSKLRGDLDNYIKTLLDGLNGKAWEDDSQVLKIVAVKA